MIIETVDEQRYFVSGSANPSRQAWFEPIHQGNIEMVLVRKGGSADTAIRDLGLGWDETFPALTSEDWKQIGATSRKRTRATDVVAPRVGVAVSTEVGFELGLFDQRHIDIDLVRYLDSNSEVVHEVKGKVDLSRSTVFEIPAELRTMVHFIECFGKGKHLLTLLAHDRSSLERSSYTKEQRRFIDAFRNLEGGRANFGVVLDYVEKLIASERTDRLPQIRVKTRGGARTPARKLAPPEDMGSLLGWIVRHLRAEFKDQPVELRDSMGRNEEELIETEDDDEPANVESSVPPIAEGVLRQCHRRVQRLTEAMGRHLREYFQSHRNGLITARRLVLTLLVLRELRKCDGQEWVGDGNTTVPLACRRDLLKEITASIYEGSVPLLKGGEYAAQEIDRELMSKLKGLIMWLVWDCGVKAHLFPFPKGTLQEHEEWFYDNALIVACSSLVSDEQGFQEAQDSIGKADLESIGWLDRIRVIHGKLSRFSRNNWFKDERDVSPGDIAVRPNDARFGFRLVKKIESDRIRLVYLGRELKEAVFQSGKVQVIPLEKIGF
ncbi:MAG: hypothetical protein HYW07_05150 [Candidatus Latescibacteria bacterium]|nr:hypothetical protein [Candidatus Latescibacterota bacterium]